MVLFTTLNSFFFFWTIQTAKRSGHGFLVVLSFQCSGRGIKSWYQLKAMYSQIVNYYHHTFQWASEKRSYKSPLPSSSDSSPCALVPYLIVLIEGKCSHQRAISQQLCLYLKTHKESDTNWPKPYFWPTRGSKTLLYHRSHCWKHMGTNYVLLSRLCSNLKLLYKAPALSLTLRSCPPVKELAS